MCHEIGGQGAWQPSLRSGRLRWPARAEWDNSRRRTPCPQCLVLVRRTSACLLVVSAYSVCVQLLGWTHPHPLHSRHFPLLMAGGGGQSGSIPAAFQSSGSSPRGRSGLRTISARVGAFLLAALSHSARQTASEHMSSQATCVRLLGWTAAPSTSLPTQGYEKTLIVNS